MYITQLTPYYHFPKGHQTIPTCTSTQCGESFDIKLSFVPGIFNFDSHQLSFIGVMI